MNSEMMKSGNYDKKTMYEMYLYSNNVVRKTNNDLKLYSNMTAKLLNQYFTKNNVDMNELYCIMIDSKNNNEVKNECVTVMDKMSEEEMCARYGGKKELQIIRTKLTTTLKKYMSDTAKITEVVDEMLSDRDNICEL